MFTMYLLAMVRTLAVLLYLGADIDRPPPYANYVPPPKVLGKLEGKYVIDTDTKLLLDGNPVRSLKDIPAGATIVEAAILGDRVTRLAFESPAK